MASVFALVFPLTSQSGAFTGKIVVYFLPVAIVACFAAGSSPDFRLSGLSEA